MNISIVVIASAIVVFCLFIIYGIGSIKRRSGTSATVTSSKKRNTIIRDASKKLAQNPHNIKVDYLGAYFNDDGVNMMHEDYFSANVSSGTRVVLDVCRNEAPDISILLHGGSNCTNCLFPVYYISGNAIKTIMAFQESYKAACDANGLRYVVTKFLSCSETPIGKSPFTLTSAMHHCCGEAAFTFESNQGLCDHGNVIYTYDEIYDSHMLLFEETIKFTLKKFNKM